MPDRKAQLRSALQLARAALVWKLDGLSEYDVRRPMTPTGTNLLGLVKHMATAEAGYLGDVFGRPFAEPFTWMAAGAEPNADMWATAAESRDQIVALYRRVWSHSDATINELALESVGTVPWWSEGRRVTVQQVLVHLIAETSRHAGHADIVRELIDGSVGSHVGNPNMADGDNTWWSSYRDRLESVAKQAGDE